MRMDRLWKVANYRNKFCIAVIDVLVHFNLAAILE
jgi:hypothetical protein